MDRKRVPDLLIEQYLLGELPADRMAEVEQSDGFRERLDALQESNGQILNGRSARCHRRLHGRRAGHSDNRPDRRCGGFVLLFRGLRPRLLQSFWSCRESLCWR